MSVRVTHMHRIAGIGGSERHLLTLLPALRAAGIDASFVGLDHGDCTEPFYRELRERAVPHRRVAAPRDLDPLLPLRLARAARAFRPDLLHTHLVHADAYGAAASLLLRVPLVSTKHNDDPFKLGRFRHVERALVQRSRLAIAITHALARFYVERVGVPPAKLEVIRYGLDEPPPAWGPNPELGGPEGPVLLVLGRLVEQKGIDVAVDALPAIRQLHPGARLVVLGEGPLRQQLLDQAAALGVADAFALPGRGGDVAAALEQADILVHPARWEGFGLVLLEAMLAAVPIVATRVSAIPEIVSDGETGVLVPADDPQALAAAVSRLLDDPELGRRLGHAGRDRARELFAVDRMARETAAAYERALSRTRSAQPATE